ncbi:MAG: stage III sporulation protein AE [Anaerotignaceae bacterium]
MKKLVCVILAMIFILIFPQNIYAEEDLNTIVGYQLDQLNLEELDQLSQEVGEEISFKDRVTDIVFNGFNFSLKDITVKIVKKLFNELFLQMGLLKKILLIAILSSLLKVLDDAFGSKETSEVGFYVCYILLIYIVIMSFYENILIVTETADRLIFLLKGMLPIFISLMIVSGQVAQSAVMGPFIMTAATGISLIIRNFIVPVIGFTSMLEIVNRITEKGILSNLSKLIKMGIEYALKGCAMAFMTITSLQRVGAGGINSLGGKVAKNVVSAVPVVGDILESSVETATALTGLIKGSVAVGAVLLVCAVLLAPVAKLVIICLIYKFSAAVMEPVCEPRLIKALDSAGDFTLLLIGAIFVISIMFVFSAIILLSVT